MKGGKFFTDAKRLASASIDLPAYMESELGIAIRWIGCREQCKCLCPFHGDSDPSFSISKGNNGWWFHCFGCGAKGSVVQFFMTYFTLSYQEALDKICEEFGINIDGPVVEKTIAVSSSLDSGKGGLLAMEHMMAAMQCRLLLRLSSDEKVRSWVKNAYSRMNECIEDFNQHEMREIYNQARDIYLTKKGEL
jgi:hypothetical protein